MYAGSRNLVWVAGADWVVDPVPAYLERDLRKYLKCGILAHGFARARCEKCGQNFLVAYSCKGRGVCVGCNTRRMVETAAHMVEHACPAVAVRQWVSGSFSGADCFACARACEALAAGCPPPKLSAAVTCLARRDPRAGSRAG